MSAIYFSPRTRQIIIGALIALALVFLFAVRSILTPFVAALITAYILNPVVNGAARRTRLPRQVWAVVLYCTLLGGLFWALGLLVPALAAQVRDLAEALPGYLRQVESWAGSNHIVIAGTPLDLQQLSRDSTNRLGDLAGELGRSAPAMALTVVERLLETIIYLVSTFFILLNADRLVAAVRAQFRPDVLAELDPWFKRITDTLGAYLRGQAILILYMMAATSLGLTLLDVHYALALGVMTGLVELIPFAGPYMAGGIALLVALTQGGNAWGWSPVALGLAVVVLYTILRQAQDNIIGPLVIGRVIELHPVAVIFFVLAGAALAGLTGLLLAVPVAATLRIVLQFIIQKLREEGPRAIVPVSATATWEDIARELRGLEAQRAVLVAPAAPPALHDPSTFRLLTIVAHEAELRLALMTDDAVATDLAGQFGLETLPLPTDLHPAAILAAGQSSLSTPLPAGEGSSPTPTPQSAIRNPQLADGDGGYPPR